MRDSSSKAIRRVFIVASLAAMVGGVNLWHHGGTLPGGVTLSLVLGGGGLGAGVAAAYVGMHQSPSVDNGVFKSG